MVRQRTDANQLRRPPTDWAGLDPIGQVPLDARRLARVSGIAPIGVPMRTDIEHQGQLDGIPRRHLRILRDKTCRDVLGAD